jgi:putative ABC transport system permease protein
MFTNYLKIAIRNLRKNKLYSAVNIIGLSIGIASCLLIGVYIADELSFDRFHANADRIARITMEYRVGDAVNKVPTTGTKVGPQLTRTLPEVTSFVRTWKYSRVVGFEDKLFEEKQFLYADSTFFSIFSFDLIQGNPRDALNAPDKIVITESMAAKYFGNANPIGRILNVGENKQFVVSAVARDCPANSQIRFDFVASFNSLGASKEEIWWTANYITYVLLAPNVSVPQAEMAVKNYMKSVSAEINIPPPGYLTYFLEPLTYVHLHSKLDGLEPNNNIVYIYILAIVAVLILLIACVNYTNLATAQSTTRTSEIAIRKVMGAKGRQLFRQFIGESVLLAILSSIVAVAVAAAVLPYFNQLAGKQLTVDGLFTPAISLSLIALALLIGLVAGAYPAFLLSNLRLIKVLKAGFAFTENGGEGLRKTLIVFQFVISVFLIASTLIILSQLRYIQNKDLGYNKDQIIVLPVDSRMRPDIDALKRSLQSLPSVSNVAAAYEEPTDINWGDGIMVGDGQTGGRELSITGMPADEHIIQTLGMKIVAGSDFTPADVQQFDTSNGNANLRYTFMINETACKALGWKPDQAIGQTVTKGYPGIVKAVVSDFHFSSLHNPIGPLIIWLDKRQIQQLFVRIRPTQPSESIKEIGALWKARVPHRPFEYHFLDDDYDALYKNEQRTAAVFTTFSTLAIVLACLGLFALTAYSVVKRLKEIGIRKVLGATTANIFSLLSQQFMKLIAIAVCIATPLAWIAANAWLSGFSYRIDTGWTVFAIAAFCVFAVAVITISFQAIKAASMNPVKTLRNE